MSSVVIIDYGMSNLRSVQRGFEKVGAKAILSSNYSEIAKADRLVLPGVGAFEDGMNGLRNAGLLEAIYDFVQTGNSLLGICLGMQMLLDCSEENGNHNGLKLIPGNVEKIPQDTNGVFRKIPYIGWATLKQPNKIDWNGSCLDEIQVNDSLYFIHSYMSVPGNKEHLFAQYEDEGLLVPAVIKKDNVIGLQFHPEKSGEVGLRVLKNFISL